MTDSGPTPLRPEELNRIEIARGWVKGHFLVEPDQCYKSVDGKLRVIEAIISSGWLEGHETWKLQALGIAFGDALSQQLMLDWVTVDDEYGCDPALHWPRTSVYCYPLTMISKRIEECEQVDVSTLFKKTCERLTEMAFSGRYT